jgi:hypothetical protein
MGKLWHRVPDGEGKIRAQEAPMADIRITEPTLVYLSGFLTNNNRPDYVSGSLKRMEHLIKDRPELARQPKMYGWTHTGLRNLFNLAAYNTFPDCRSSQAGYAIGKAILMPLVTDASGAPVAMDEAKNNVKNVTFFGYSAGSIVAQETFNATLKMMTKAGYDEKKAREILNEVVLISVGNISRPTREANRFTTIYLAATNDVITRAKNWIRGPIGTLRRAFSGTYMKIDKPLTLRLLSKTSIFIAAPARPSLYEWEYNGDGTRREKKFFDPLFPRWWLARSYHELPHYVTTDENNNPFANIAMYAVLNALNRTGTPDPLKLVAATPGETEDRVAYRAKIAEALRPMPKALQI